MLIVVGIIGAMKTPKELPLVSVEKRPHVLKYAYMS